MESAHPCMKSCTAWAHVPVWLPFRLQGIYFAAKSGRMCAEAIVEASQGGKKMCGESAIRVYLDK